MDQMQKIILEMCDIFLKYLFTFRFTFMLASKMTSLFIDFWFNEKPKENAKKERRLKQII